MTTPPRVHVLKQPKGGGYGPWSKPVKNFDFYANISMYFTIVL